MAHDPDPPSLVPEEERTSPAYAVRLTVKQGHAVGQVHTIRRFPAVVGRSQSADIQIEDDPADPKISRQHMRLSLAGGCITVEDLSTNGTHVGERLVGPGQTVALGQAGTVMLGPHTAVYVEIVSDVGSVVLPAPPSGPGRVAAVGDWLKSLAGIAPKAERSDAAHAVEIRSLGAFTLTADGTPVPDELWQHRKAVVLVVHLADTRQPASADRLAEILWPDAADGRQSVQTAVSRVRRAMRSSNLAAGFPDLVCFERKLYGLAPSCSIWYDVAEFESWMREAQKLWAARDLEGAGRALECALDLYRGPFLEGFDEGWVVRRRTWLERSRFEALEMLGALREEERQWVEAAQMYQGILDADPAREQAHLGLIRSLAGQGRRDDAIRQCVESITTLKKLLNLPPSAELEALYRSLAGSG